MATPIVHKNGEAEIAREERLNVDDAEFSALAAVEDFANLVDTSPRERPLGRAPMGETGECQAEDRGDSSPPPTESARILVWR
jgi:hypothetical protein